MLRSRGFGFVKFETAAQAQAVLAKNGDIVVRDKTVDVCGWLLQSRKSLIFQADFLPKIAIAVCTSCRF